MSATWVALGASMVLLLTVAAGVWLRRAALSAPPSDEREPTVYELAAMVGGERRVVEVAAAFLVWTGVFETRENTRRVMLTAAPSANNEFHPVEVALINAAGMEGKPAGAVLSAGMYVAERVADGLDGLAVNRRVRTRLAAVPGVLGSALALTLGWWMWRAWSAGDSLGWVPVVFGVSLVVAAVALIDPPYATSAGAEIVRRRRHATEPDLEVASLGVTSLPLVRGMNLVALHGKEAMTGELRGLRNLL